MIDLLVQYLIVGNHGGLTGEIFRYCTKAFVSSVSLNTVLFVNINYVAPCTCSGRYGSRHKCKYK